MEKPTNSLSDIFKKDKVNKERKSGEKSFYALKANVEFCVNTQKVGRNLVERLKRFSFAQNIISVVSFHLCRARARVTSQQTWFTRDEMFAAASVNCHMHFTFDTAQQRNLQF